MKKILSFLLVPALLFCMLALPCHAAAGAQDDIISSSCFKTGPYYPKFSDIYRIILSPVYVTRAEVVIIDRWNDDKVLTEQEDYTVCRETITNYGECYVIYILSKGISPYLQRGSFKRENGNGNTTIYLLENLHNNNRCVVDFDKKINLGQNTMQPEGSINITFTVKGSVEWDDTTLAENVREYTHTLSDPGEHTLILSVGGLTVGKYTITVKNREQMNNERIAELQSELPEIVKDFFLSLPVALLMLPTAPLIMVGWVPALLALSPIEFAGRFFDTLSELRQLKAQQ